MITATRPPATIRIRPIRPTDLDRLEAFYAGLSADSRNARFHGASRGIADADARRFCGPDHHHREGLVAVIDGVDDVDRAPIVGHLCLEPAADGQAEMAVAVADAWQHQGVGRALLEAAVRWAEANGIDRLTAAIRWSNPAIAGLLRSVHRPVSFRSTADGGTEAILDVGTVVPAAA
jgi:GNAT superfamily N-acetyltransferase